MKNLIQMAKIFGKKSVELKIKCINDNKQFLAIVPKPTDIYDLKSMDLRIKMFKAYNNARVFR